MLLIQLAFHIHLSGCKRYLPRSAGRTAQVGDGVQQVPDKYVGRRAVTGDAAAYVVRMRRRADG